MRIRPAAITLALLALVAAFAAATAKPAAAAGKPCWERVIDDWLDNGTIDGTYKAACYQQALKHVPEDLRDYSNITDAISAALSNSLRGTKGNGSGTGTGYGPTGAGGTSGNGKSNAGPNRQTLGVPSQSYYTQGINKLGTTKASSIPIPLLVLAGLGALLLISAGGLATQKRLKARSGPPPT